MNKEITGRFISSEKIADYADFLKKNEKSAATILKYVRDLKVLAAHFNGVTLTKAALIDWKDNLIGKYVARSINSFIASLNGFLKFMHWDDMALKTIKIQEATYRDDSRTLTFEEYKRLVYAAENTGNRRLSMIIQTICTTGIRVSELQYITVEAVKKGKVEVINKGKARAIILPDDICRSLMRYINEVGITSGVIFTTRSGKPLNRSNIWRDMKRLCRSADVAPEKVFPHNLRHLFAVIHYAQEKDLSRLADLLGHSHTKTTRIYTKENGSVHRQQINRMHLAVT